jgi:hypothetical protein
MSGRSSRLLYILSASILDFLLGQRPDIGLDFSKILGSDESSSA